MCYTRPGMKKIHIVGRYTFETVAQAMARAEGYRVVPGTGRKFVVLERENGRYVDFNTDYEISKDEVEPCECGFVSTGGEGSQFWIYKDPVVSGFILHALGKTAEELRDGSYTGVEPGIMKELYDALFNLWEMKCRPVPEEECLEYTRKNLHFHGEDPEEERCHIEMFLAELGDTLDQLEPYMERHYDSHFIACAEL